MNNSVQIFFLVDLFTKYRNIWKHSRHTFLCGIFVSDLMLRGCKPRKTKNIPKCNRTGTIEILAFIFNALRRVQNFELCQTKPLQWLRLLQLVYVRSAFLLLVLHAFSYSSVTCSDVRVIRENLRVSWCVMHNT